MKAREQVLKVLDGLPAGVVRWAADPVEEPPRLSTGVAELDLLMGGGWPRGRVSVLAGRTWSTGASSLLARTMAVATRGGGRAALVDGDDSLDPASLRSAGADLERVLWVRGPLTFAQGMRAVEEVLLAGGFEVVGVRVGEGRTGPGAMWVRVARAAERSRAVVLAVGCGGGGRTAPVPGTCGVRLDPATALWGGGRVRVLIGARSRLVMGRGEAEVSFVVSEADPWVLFEVRGGQATLPERVQVAPHVPMEPRVPVRAPRHGGSTP